MSNYQQPDYRIPTVPVDSKGNPLGVVGVQQTINQNPLNINAAQTPYVQPGVSAPAAPVAGQLTGGSLGISVAQSNIGSSPASGE